MRLFSRMLGECKVFETSDPSRDVWGGFNPLMEYSFLVNLNEISLKDTTGAIGFMKKLITDPTITINKKGIDPFNINSFHRFLTTSNNDECIPTSDGDRRNLIIRSSDEMKGNREYFTKLNQYLDDVNVVKTCYEYFKQMENIECDYLSLPIPETEYQNNLKQLSVNPILLFLEYYTFVLVNEYKNNKCDELSEYEVEKSNNEIFTKFQYYIQKYGYTYDCNSNKLSVRIRNLKIDGIDNNKDTHKRGKVFNLLKLSQKYNIDLEG